MLLTIRTLFRWQCTRLLGTKPRALRESFSSEGTPRFVDLVIMLAQLGLKSQNKIYLTPRKWCILPMAARSSLLGPTDRSRRRVTVFSSCLCLDRCCRPRLICRRTATLRSAITSNGLLFAGDSSIARIITAWGQFVLLARAIRRLQLPFRVNISPLVVRKARVIIGGKTLDLDPLIRASGLQFSSRLQVRPRNR